MSPFWGRSYRNRNKNGDTVVGIESNNHLGDQLVVPVFSLSYVILRPCEDDQNVAHLPVDNFGHSSCLDIFGHTPRRI